MGSILQSSFSVLIISTFILCLSLSWVSQVHSKTFKGRQMYKIREAGSRPIHFHVCGDYTYYMFQIICFRRRHKRNYADDIITDKNRANQYLKRGAEGARRQYNIVEECCLEGCVIEEVNEYCPN